MAFCNICTGIVETHNYVRAKAMVSSGETGGRTVYKPAPKDEHLFFGLNEPQYEYTPEDKAAMCQGHSEELILSRIEKELKPGAKKPTKMLFNPSRFHLPLLARRQRINRELETRYGAPENIKDSQVRQRLLQLMIDDEDKDRRVKVDRVPGETDGLRTVVVEDTSQLSELFFALLGKTGA